ncbi:unnamed protein product [Sympodiomycopsis kandeliae]
MFVSASPEHPPGLQCSIAADPNVPWQLQASWGCSRKLHQMSDDEFSAVFRYLRSQSRRLSTVMLHLLRRNDVGRIGMLYDGLSSSVRLTPMAGTQGPWKAIITPAFRYDSVDPGYIDTASGPRLSNDTLSHWQRRLCATTTSTPAPNCAFTGTDPDSLFARIVQGKEEHWRVYEDEGHVAFLTPFANSPYCAVLVPRRNETSDIFGLDDDVYLSLIKAVHTFANQLTERLEASGVGIAFEGFEIDYAHVKFYPRFASSINLRVEAVAAAEYAGMLTSLPGERLPGAELVKQRAILESISME